MAEPGRPRSLGALAEETGKRTLGSPALFAITYSTLAASVYFSIGVVSDHALGLTPVVFGAAALFFFLCQMTYVEGASLHQERAGSTVFARYAFNELWSFVAGWALLLDGVILLSLCAFSATNYLAALDHHVGSGALEIVVAAAVIAVVAAINIRGARASRLDRFAAIVMLDAVVLAALVVVGCFTVLDMDAIFGDVELGSRPSWDEAVFGLTIAAAAFTGLESASGLAGEVAVGRRGLRKLVMAGSAAVLLVYVGVSMIALSALPPQGDETGLSRFFVDAPLLGVADELWPGRAASDIARLVVGATASIALFAAASAAMLAVSRLAYSLARYRQIPSAIGRVHTSYSTPWVAISITSLMAFALVIPADLDFLIGIFAFGAMLAFTLAHVSVIVLRYREPDRPRPYRMPLNLRVGGGDLPLPAVLGALLSAAGWVSVLLLHEGARYVGLAWMALGVSLYVIYRRSEGKSLYRRVEVPVGALRKEAPDVEYASILVPLLGTEVDDDIIQTAGRLARERGVEDGDTDGAEIEALWVFEIPMSLPLDARLPEEQWLAAKKALQRAREVGEEYGGVQVHGTRVRARRTGQAIVEQAQRRAVQAIVMAAEPPSRIRGGTLLGGIATPENFVGEVTRYVIEKAPCTVILTAPPTE